jgi:hypothetical protein
MIVLRELLVILGGLSVIYGIYRWATRVKRKEGLREARSHIEDTLSEAQSIPPLNTEKLQKARDKINDFLKEGKKNA